MWLKVGDKNINYFHKKAEGRRRQNLISRIHNPNSHVVEEDVGIAQIFLNHFKNLFTSSGSSDMNIVIDVVDKKLEDHMRDFLL